MKLRKGKTKNILESAIDSALLAVEIYNKPRCPFRVESFITNMIMSWTRLFHAYFQNTIGEKYFYKEKNGHYKIIDGEKKAWELGTCIVEYNKSASVPLAPAVQANLDFFIKLRNKIEHRIIRKEEIGIIIFGECQSLLYNFENELITIFGEEYALNENLAYALQFSRVRTNKQTKSSKRLLSNEVKEIKDFIDTYRSTLNEDVFNSQEYSIKLIQIPKIANTNKNDLAIEFVNLTSLSEDDKKKYEKMTALIKDKVIKIEAINASKLKPSSVIEKVNARISVKINSYDHKCLAYTFSIRPYKKKNQNANPFDTNTKYCHYDEAHKDYLYQEAWVELLVAGITSGQLVKQAWRDNFENSIKLNIQQYEI